MNSTWTSKQCLKRAIGRDLPSVGGVPLARQSYLPAKSGFFQRSQPLVLASSPRLPSRQRLFVTLHRHRRRSERRSAHRQ